LIADWKSGVPKLLEPGMSESWIWYDIDSLPDPIFEPCKLALRSYKTGENYFDIPPFS
jgi:hypothetical protein